MKIKLNIAWGEGSERILMKMAAFSAVGHAVALVIFSVLPRFIQPAAPPRATIAEIIPASALFPQGSPAGKPARPLASAPTPSQRAEAAREAAKDKVKPSPERPRSDESERSTRKKSDPTVPPLDSRKKEPEPASTGPPPQAEAPTQPEPSPAPASASSASGISFGGAGSVGGIPSIGSSAFPYDYYRSSLVAILQSNWRRPVTPEGLRETASCRVQFTILKSGIIQDPKVVAPSGNDALDRSALRAVYDSSPLPPLPFQYGHASVSAEVLFELTPD